MNLITAEDYVKIIIPLIAIILSIISLVRTNRNTKRQIRIGKLEEILEITSFYSIHYYDLYDLYLILEDIKATGSEKKFMQDQYDRKVERIKEYLNYKIIEAKHNRINIIGNSYLSNNTLKKQLMAVNNMILYIASYALEENNFLTQVNFSDGYPDVLSFGIYLERVQMKLIKEMDLGYDSLKSDEALLYQVELRKDIKKIDEQLAKKGFVSPLKNRVYFDE